MKRCWSDFLTPENPTPEEPVFLTLPTVLQIHDTLIGRFGGTFGLRDMGLLESALASPQGGFGGQRLNVGFAEMASSYLISLVGNHPFVDGNKRTAYAAMATFLRLNGLRLGLSQAEKFELVLGMAEGRLGKTDVVQLLAENLEKL